MRTSRTLLAAVAALLVVLASPAHASAASRAPRDFFGLGAAVGSPGEMVSGKADAGAVHVFLNDAPFTTLDPASSTIITRATIGGTPAAGDEFGRSVAVGDVNGDSLADVVIGAPGADNDAGRVYVLLRQPATGELDLDDPVVLRQGIGGLVGTSEAGDRFGAALYIGARSGGDAWLAIGAPGEDIGAANGAGVVTVVPDGTDTTADFSRYQGSGLPGTAESGDAFGSSLAGYGLGGLAAGAPGEDIGAAADAGNVIGMAATIGGLPSSGAETSFQQGVGGTPGVNESGDRFGASLVGRLQNALSIGVPGQDIGAANGAGAVVDLQVPGQIGVVNTVWWQGAGLDGTAESGDGFGSALSATNNGNLVIGVPGEDVGAFADAGFLQLLGQVGGGNASLTGAVEVSLHADSPGVPGVAEAGDRFGAALGEGVNTVLVGVPGEDVGAANSAGALVVLRVGGTGLIDTSLAGQQIHQDTPGVDSTAETGDDFGGSVAGRQFPGET